MNGLLGRAAQAPTHHPPEEFLIDLASGGASGAEALMIETHLAFCPACRKAARALEDAGGALLTSLAPVGLPPNMLNRALRAIEKSEDATPSPERPSLGAFIRSNLAAKDWRKLPGGFRLRRVDGDRTADGAKSGRIWLFDAPPRMKVLPHRHVGDEWTVVLSGEFHDGGECYQAGDFAWQPDGHGHQPTVGRDARCVCLIMVRETPLYTSALGKIAAPFLRL
jgi:putative transcriptional regulator